MQTVQNAARHRKLQHHSIVHSTYSVMVCSIDRKYYFSALDRVAIQHCWKQCKAFFVSKLPWGVTLSTSIVCCQTVTHRTKQA